MYNLTFFLNSHIIYRLERIPIYKILISNYIEKINKTINVNVKGIRNEMVTSINVKCNLKS